MIDPTVLRTLCESAEKRAIEDARTPWTFADEALLGLRNVRFDVSHLRALLDENAALRAERDFLLEAVKASEADGLAYGKLIAEMAAVAEAVRSVCPSDETTGVTEEFKYVCHDEDGEPIVEASTLGDAVAQIIACWNRGGEQHEALESRLAALKAAGNAVIAGFGDDPYAVIARDRPAVVALSELLRSDPNA